MVIALQDNFALEDVIEFVGPNENDEIGITIYYGREKRGVIFVKREELVRTLIAMGEREVE